MLSRAILRETPLARPSHHLSSSSSFPSRRASLFFQSPIPSRRISQTIQNCSSLPDGKPSTSPKKTHEASSENHTLPTLSLKDLTASRSAYYVILLALSILGTMETIFYGKLVYTWYFAAKEQDEADEE